MKKRKLEIFLESLDGFKNPKITLEQYVTPPPIAAEIVMNAYLNKDLNIVYDLGCGTGILAIASALLGAYSVGVDVDKEALIIAKRNSIKAEVEIELIQNDVRFFEVSKRGTVITNPPFGIQKRFADRIFIEKALEIGDVVYSIHSIESEEFITKRARAKGFKITHLWKVKMPLRKTYSFHEKPFKYIPVEIYRMERI